MQHTHAIEQIKIRGKEHINYNQQQESEWLIFLVKPYQLTFSYSCIYLSQMYIWFCHHVWSSALLKGQQFLIQFIAPAHTHFSSQDTFLSQSQTHGVTQSQVQGADTATQICQCCNLMEQRTKTLFFIYATCPQYKKLSVCGVAGS